MTLLDTISEPLCIMDRTTISDWSGIRYQWKDGARFDALVRKDSNPEILVAEKQGIAEQYTIIFDKSVTLSYNDVLKRLSDGAIFRVTSNSVDSVAPAPSTVPKAKVTAERWVLT